MKEGAWGQGVWAVEGSPGSCAGVLALAGFVGQRAWACLASKDREHDQQVYDPVTDVYRPTLLTSPGHQ